TRALGAAARLPWFRDLDRTPTPARRPRVHRGSGMDPTRAARAIVDALPVRARIACDISSAALHLLGATKLAPEKRLWLQIERSACMGAAVAAGIGLSVATELPTVAVIGDWGLLMSGSSELSTIACLDLPGLVVVVWSNSGGALIRDG